MFIIELIVRPEISLADQPFEPINPWFFESGDFECIENLLSHLCDQMQQSGAVDFRVSGFGQAIWPCEVRVEFHIFLEQLPAIYTGLTSKAENTMLDFFEQGMERTIVFRFKDEELLVAECSYNGWELEPKWEPSPSEEVILQSDLMTMLEKTFITFLNIVKEMNPKLYAHHLFQDWINQSSLKNLNNSHH